MSHTYGINPARVVFVDRHLECFRLRTYGHRATCPDCGWTKVYTSPREAAACLNEHRLIAHGSTD